MSAVFASAAQLLGVRGRVRIGQQLADLVRYVTFDTF